MTRGLKDDLPDGESGNACDTLARRANHLAIPEAAQRLSGIHLSRRLVVKWIPGSPFRRPGMTTVTSTYWTDGQTSLSYPTQNPGSAGSNLPPTRTGATFTASPVASSVSTATPESVAGPSAGSKRAAGMPEVKRRIGSS